MSQEFIVTDPSGKEHVVTAPDGATQEQALAYAQQQFAQKPIPSMGAVVQNAANKGIAAVPDALLNAPNNVLNLGKAAFGTVATMAGRPDLAPGLTPNPDLVRRGMTAMGFIRPEAEPQTGGQRLADAVTQGATGGIMTGGASVPAVAAGGAMGGLSAGAAHVATDMTGNPAWGAVAGMTAPAAASAVAQFAGPVLEGGGRRVMQSALKPTWEAHQSGDAARAIDTMLNEGVNVSYGGLDKLRTLIGQLNSQIDTLIANSPATINKPLVASRLHDALNKFERQVNPNSDTAAIQQAWTEFLQHPLLPTNDIPVQLAQEIKKGTYQIIGDKAYGKELTSASADAQKHLARGLREEIATAVPEVNSLNAREGNLINAEEIARRRVLMEGNKNPVGLGWLNPAELLPWLLDRSGPGKSMIARGMYQSGKAAPKAQSLVTPSMIGLPGILQPRLTIEQLQGQ